MTQLSPPVFNSRKMVECNAHIDNIGGFSVKTKLISNVSFHFYES